MRFHSYSQYAAVSQLKLHGYTEEDGLIVLQNRPGEHILRTEDILATIKAHGDSVAVIFMSGVHYYTGISIIYTELLIGSGC